MNKSPFYTPIEIFLLNYCVGIWNYVLTVDFSEFSAITDEYPFWTPSTNIVSYSFRIKISKSTVEWCRTDRIERHIARKSE